MVFKFIFLGVQDEIRSKQNLPPVCNVIPNRVPNIFVNNINREIQPQENKDEIQRAPNWRLISNYETNQNYSETEKQQPPRPARYHNVRYKKCFY